MSDQLTESQIKALVAGFVAVSISSILWGSSVDTVPLYPDMDLSHLVIPMASSLIVGYVVYSAVRYIQERDS